MGIRIEQMTDDLIEWLAKLPLSTEVPERRVLGPPRRPGDLLDKAIKRARDIQEVIEETVEGWNEGSH